MCGINGIVDYSGEARKYADALQRMNEALAHRGPDDGGLYLDGSAALGHRRLSIIDLSDAGRQPMVSDDGRFVMVFNGEIYNYEELRAQLEYPFRSRTDSEVLLAAWQVWGVHSIDRLKGMFAFAVWDREKSSLHLVRDRLGIKPLYYFNDRTRIAFSSEIRPILRSNILPPKLSREGLVDYLRYQCVHQPETIVEGVHLLPPGTHMEVSSGGIRRDRYWTAAGSVKKSGLSAPETRRAVHDSLMRAVERRLVSDVPFGAFLSGGIDSSAVVALMSGITDDVNTFSVTFAEEKYSEARYARMVAEKFGTRHHEIVLRPADFLGLVPDALNAMDHPSGDGPNTYVVSKATKEAGITMALSGLGGDELFAGYPIFAQSVRLEKLQVLNQIPKPLRVAAGALLRKVQPSIASSKIAHILSGRKIDALSAYPFYRQVFLDSQVRDLLKDDALPGNRVVAILHEELGDGERGELDVLSRVSVAEISTYMQNVLLRDTDQMSMAHALEVRVPFLDHELVELVLGVSDSMKYPHSPKELLVDALGDLLPLEVVHRPKMGFTLPFEHWMRGELRDYCDNALNQLLDRPHFRADAVRSCWNDFLAGRPTISWSRLWMLVVLGHWIDRNGVA